MGLPLKVEDPAAEAGRRVDDYDEYIEKRDKFMEAERELERLRRDGVRPTTDERIKYLNLVLEERGYLDAARG